MGITQIFAYLRDIQQRTDNSQIQGLWHVHHAKGSIGLDSRQAIDAACSRESEEDRFDLIS